MSIARRSFLKSATLTTLSAGLALGSAHFIFGQKLRRVGRVDGGDFPIPTEAQQDALFFKSTTFSPYVGDIFQAPNARGEMIALELTRVRDYKSKAGTKLSTRKSIPTESFSLTFSSREQLPPLTSIHKMSHPALGKFDLFLTRHETENGTFMYEATFNRKE